MLKRSKAISIVLAFIFCMSFMAPAFVAPDVAQAGSTYEVIKAPTVKNSDTNAPLGVIKVTFADQVMIPNSKVTVSLPSDISVSEGTKTDPIPKSVQDYVYVNPVTEQGIFIIAPGSGSNDGVHADSFKADWFKINSDNSFDIQMGDAATNTTAGSDKYFYIYFNNIDLKNTSGDIEVTFFAPSGSGFSSSGPVVIAKSSSSGATTTTLKKVRDITDSADNCGIDSITIVEDRYGSINFGSDKKITLEILTNGFKWNSENGKAEFGWSLANQSKLDVERNKSDHQKMQLDLSKVDRSLLDSKFKTDSEAKITISGLKIDIDDSKADPGDEVEVKVSGADMTSATFVVAKYVDYGVVVEEGTTKTLIAGQGDQKLGEFYIKEGAAGSLVEDRTIKFTLPSGVEWKGSKTADIDWEITNSSSMEFNGDYKISGDDDQVLTLTISTNGSSKNNTEGAKIKFKDFKVNVSPAFTGDIELEVSGSAGATGTVKVAEVVPAAKISVDKVNNIILGKANQKVADITLTEGDVEGLLEGDLVLKFDRDYRWSKEPTVKVTEGNLDIDEDVSIDNEKLTIKVTGQSSKNASTILISDIYVDAYRTAPEGPISLEFEKGCSALFEADKMNGYTTGSDSKPSFKDKSAGKAVVANCVTAAMGETIGNGQFVIGSNIYEMNGVKKVMDAAPYVKNDRTYVPVRYLGYVLGLTDDDIVWDQAAQKVTFTKGDNTVELVIGSTTITVNGEEQVMDVAPEISSDRTMLPARYVAEAFGFNVGWDAINQIVLISK
jgi:hypothetical protein